MTRYQAGRGFGRSGGRRQQGQGFWAGRPEFTGGASNYDRWTIRPLTVARGDPRATLRVAGALAFAGKEFYNYKKRGGAEGYAQRMEEGGEYYARGLDRQADYDAGKEPGTTWEAGKRFNDQGWRLVGTQRSQNSEGGSRPSGYEIFDTEPRDYQKESDEWEEANPYTAKVLGDVTRRGEDLSTPGMLVRGGKKIFTQSGRQELKGAYNEIRGGGGVAGTMDPFEEPKPKYDPSSSADWYADRQARADAQGGKKDIWASQREFESTTGDVLRTSGFIDPITGESLETPKPPKAPF